MLPKPTVKKRLLLISFVLLFLGTSAYAQGISCASAETLLINGSCDTNTFISNTTQDLPNASGCSMGNFRREGWYTFDVTTGPQLITITANADNRNLYLQLISSSGSCSGLSQIACANAVNSNSTQTETITTTLNNGKYFIKVINCGQNGNMLLNSICITSPVTNGSCATATALPCNTTISGTTVGATGSTPNNTGCSLSDYGVWYNFVGDGNYNIISSTAAAGFNHEMVIVSGTCRNFTTVTCEDNALSGGTESYNFITTLGENYYIYVADFDVNSTTTGSFSVTRECISCMPPVMTPISNLTQNSVTLNWNVPLVAPSSGYQYAVTTSATPPASGTFTTATTANVTGLVANLVYYGHVRSDCGNGDFSTWDTIQFQTGYCTFSANSGYYFIDNFSTTNGISNINNNSTFSPGGYGNYSAYNIVSQYAGLSFDFSATVNGGTHGMNVWIDWNKDMEFDDATELVFESNGYVANANGTITIPIGTLPGDYRLRIVANYFDTTPSACGSFPYTEAEDYTVYCQGTLPCAGFPSAIFHNVISQTEVEFYWNEANPIPSNGYDYYFASSPSPTPNFTTTATGSVSAGNTNVIISSLTPGNTYYFWVRSNCGASLGNGGWVGPFQVIMPTCNVGNSMGTTDLSCPSVIAGGLDLNGADVEAIDCSSTSTCVTLEANYLNLGETSDYVVESIPFNPPYNFSCLKNPVSVNIDDIWSPRVKLPFNFCFYGNNYDECLIGSNGILTFDTTNNIPGGVCNWGFDDNIPISGDSSLIENAIFGAFSDIDPSLGGEVGWELITLNSGCRALVASWNNIPTFSTLCNSQLYTGMIVLYENTNVIEVYIQQRNACSTWNDGNGVIGIQNADGTLATVAPNRNGLDPDWSTTNEAWRFIPSGNSITSIAWHEGSGTSGPVLGTSNTLAVCPTETTTYTAAITYALCNGNTLVETDETTVVFTGGKIWNGSVSSDWDNDNNWTPTGKPIQDDCVFIPETAIDPVVQGENYNAVAKNLTILANANLTVNSNNYITVNERVAVDATATFTLNDSASLIQIEDTANTGNITMHRNVNIRKQDYVYWSSPVQNFLSSAISPATSTSLIWKWEPTISSYLNGYGIWVNGNENMTLGKGYIVRGPNNYSTTTLQNFTATFNGVANNGTIAVPIYRGTYTGTDYNTGSSNTLATKDDDNWNLLGNPYPSAIDADDFLISNTNVEGFIKLWTHGTLPSSIISSPFYGSYAYNYTLADYLTYNLTGPLNGPGYFGGKIASGQGFFVLMNDTGTTAQTAVFNNSLRSHLYENDEFFRTNNNQSIADKNRIWLDLLNTTTEANTRTLVGYIENATKHEDRLYDAKLESKLSFSIYSLIKEKEFAIQGIGLPFTSNEKIKLGYKAPQDGNYSILIGAVDGLFEDPNQTIVLEDLELNIEHDLRRSPYNFTTTQGANNERFILKFKFKNRNNALLKDGNTVVVSKNETSVTVNATDEKIKSVVVFDFTGKQIATALDENANEVVITQIQRKNEYLLVQTTLNDGTIITKKVLF
ncbi:GEVED domain-containing protein [Flavobacterium sp.]|uniref:GEVED domain-containing protein n=1 Tax=Flavobacterium sp. TaxID=239 RepID=UPI0035273085